MKVSNLRTSLLPVAALGLAFASSFSFAQDESQPPAPKPEPGKDAPKPEKPVDGIELPIKPTRQIDFTTEEGTWMALDVSPDGKTIVFELVGDLYTMPITGGEAKLLVGSFAYDGMPRFSPDGKKVLFVSDRSGADNLWTVDLDGKNLKAITKGRNTMYLSPIWGPDGNTVFASKASGQWAPPFKIQMIDLRGGSGTQIGTPSPRANRMGLTISPDGRYVYYSERQGPWDYNATFPMFGIYRYDRKKGQTTLVSQARGSSMRPQLSPDGKFLVYATRDRTETGLRIRDLSNGEERWLAYPFTRDDQESRATRDTLPGFAFLPDGKSIITNLHGKIQKVDLASGKNTIIPFKAKVSMKIAEKAYRENTLPDSTNVRARFVRELSISPDGNTAVFTALGRIYTQDLSNKDAKPKRLTAIETTSEFTPIWSPNGKQIIFSTWDDVESGALYLINSDGSGLRKVTSSPGAYLNASFLPDGQSILVQQTTRLGFLDAMMKHRETLMTQEPTEPGGSNVPQETETRLVKLATGESERFPVQAGNFQTIPGVDRLYYKRGGTLFSSRLDGYEERAEVAVTGTGTFNGGMPTMPDSILLSPDGTQVLVGVDGKLHILNLAQTGTTLNLSSMGGMFPAKMITAEGNDSAQWSADGKSVIWTQGYKLFKQSVTGTDKPTSSELIIEKPRAVPQGKILLQGARVITMKGDTVLPKGDILLINNKIAAVGPSGSFEVPKGTKVMNLNGKTISPGYVDVHSHWFGNYPVGYPYSWGYLANLAFGVTTNRDPQSGTTQIYDYADAVEAGDSVGPRQLTTGPGVFPWDPVDDLDSTKTYLKRYAEAYNTWYIKEYITGDRTTRQNVAIACKELGLTPATEGALEIKRAMTEILDGYTGHEHSLPVELYDDMAQFLAKTGTYYTPTLLVTYGGPWGEEFFFQTENPSANPKVQKFVPRALLDDLTRRRKVYNLPEEYFFTRVAQGCAKVVRAGGRVCLGSHGEFQGMGAHWEMWALASGGLSPLEVLRCATLFGAEALGLQKQVGSIEPGKLADLVIYDKNPLENIRNTNTIKYVVKNGEIYEGDTLDKVYPVAKKLPKFYWEGNEPKVTINK